MKSTFKTKLLLGAAVTALSFGAAGAANAVDLTANTTLGAGDLNAPAANVDVDLKGFDLTVDQSDNTAIGAITDTGTTPDGNIIITTTGAGDVSQTIGSIDNGTGNFTLVNTAADGDIVANVTGAMTIGSGTTGNLVINNADTTTVDVVTLTVGGNATVAGTTTITANAGAGEDATLNLNGATNVFTGGIVLDDGAAGLASVNFANTAAGTFTGTINAASATDEGTVNVINGANEMRFVNAIGATGTEILALNVGTEAGAAGTAEFDGAVLAATINVNGEQGATTADFDGNVTATAMNVLSGGTAGDTANVTMSGTALNIGTLTLDTQAGGDVATVTFDGTSAQTFTGNITTTDGDEGLLQVNNSTTFTGQLGANDIANVNVASGATATYNTTNATIGVDSTNLTGSGVVVVQDNGVGGDVTLDGAVTAATDGAGTLRATGAETVIVSGAVGTNTNDIGAIQVTGLADGEGLTLQGNVYANGIAIDATTATDSNTVTLGAGANGDTVVISGNITSAEDNEHTLVLAADTAQTITGNIGTSTGKFATLTVTESATVGGNIYATAATVANTETLTLTGTSATVSSNFGGSAGNIVIGNGTDAAGVTFTGNIDNDAVTVEDSSTATFNGTVDTDANLVVGGATAAGTARFNSRATIGGTSTLDGNVYFGNENATTANTFTGAVTVAGNQASTITLAGHSDIEGGITFGAEGTTLLINKTATFNPADADGNGTAGEATDMILDASGQAVTRTGNITIGLAADTQEIDSGTVIHVLESNAATYNTGLGDGTIILRDTAFVRLVDNSSDTDSLFVRVENKSAADVIGTDAVGVNAANTLLGISNANTTAELETIKGNLQGAATTEAAQDIANSLAPNVDAGAFAGATAVVNVTSGITNTQLASLRDGTETGMYAGNISQGLRTWGQVFGQTGDQDERDGVAGFEVDTYGFAIGLDTETLAENWIWGLAFAYADTEVDSKGVNDTNTEIDSYQVSLYSNYDLDDRTYISGQVGYTWGDNDQTRSNIGGAGLVANSDYDSETWTARLEAGRKYAVGSNTILTPKALVNYQHYSADGYTETGTVGNAGLVVNDTDLDLFEIGVGVDASWDYQNADGSFWQPKIGVGVRHDLIGDEYETTSRFIGAGASFDTDGFDPAQTTFNVGADVTYFSTTNWELSAGYDYEIKSDYDAHSGMVRAGYKF